MVTGKYHEHQCLRGERKLIVEELLDNVRRLENGRRNQTPANAELNDKKRPRMTTLNTNSVPKKLRIEIQSGDSLANQSGRGTRQLRKLKDSATLN